MPTDEEYAAQLESTPEAQPQPDATPTAPVPGGVEALELAIGGKTQSLPLDTEIPVQHDGRLIKVPMSKILNHYRQREGLEGKWTDFKGQKAAFEQERGDFNEYTERKKGLDEIQKLQDWTKELETKNPAGFTHLMNTIDKIKNMGFVDGQTTDDGTNLPGIDVQTLNQTLTGMSKRMDELASWKTEQDARVTQQQEQKDWDDVQGDVKTFSEKFPEFELDSTDEEGTKLWAKVVHWGNQNGYQDFTPAAYAFFGDRLSDTLMQRGRNETVKGIRKDANAGVVARSSTPFDTGNGQGVKVDPSKLSYDQLEEAAIAAAKNMPTG